MSGRREHPADPPAAQEAVHLLSFDVEEYFQVEAAAATVPRRHWGCYEKRLEPVVGRILRLLAEQGASATFFVLGWVARNEGAVVARIADAGHEIASHGMDHRMIQYLTPAQLRRQLCDSRKLLEDIAARPVAGYRAPTFSITRRTAWALDVLAEAGFIYDSSVFPIRHDRYGVPGAPAFAHRAVGPGGGSLLEIPPLTVRVGGANLPFGGGGYFRLLPVSASARALRIAQRAGRCGMLYLHPWEFDPDQPILPMSRLARWRHRVGLGRSEAKLRRLLRQFRFTDVRTQLGRLREQAGQSYLYGRRQ